MSAPTPDLFASTDPYLLRNLLWCVSHLRMHPHPSGGQRTYKCGFGCRKKALPAYAIESATWNAAERRATLTGIAPPFRRSVLERMLVKVVVCGYPTDLTFTWRI